MADIEIKRVPRIDVAKAGSLVGTRPRINLIEGSNVTLTVTDDSAGNEVDVTIAASGSATPSDFQPAIVTGNYYTSQLFASSYGSTNAPGNGILVAYPIWFSSAETWTRIAAYVATGTGSAADKIRLGIWSDNNGLPGALLVDSGELSLENSGEIAATISEALSANTLYWIGYIANDAAEIAELRSGYVGRTLAALCGISSTDLYYGMCVQRAVAYGALPDPWGTPDGVFDAASMVWLRKV